MIIHKIPAFVGAALLTGGLLAAAAVQAQPYPQRGDFHRPPHAVHRDHRPLPPMAVGRSAPYEYRGNNYRVDNWQRYHLRRPRRGQHWVRYGGQFLLLNPAGVVIQVFVP